MCIHHLSIVEKRAVNQGGVTAVAAARIAIGKTGVKLSLPDEMDVDEDKVTD